MQKIIIAPKVADAAAFVREHKVGLRRLELDVQSQRSVDDAIAAIVADRVRAELFRRIGVEDLLHPRDTLAPAAL